jgi:hypothetical protein
MPQTRLERIIAIIGVLAIIGLVAVILPMWLRYRHSEPAASRSPGPPARPVATAARSTARTATATPSLRREYALRATGGDCWLEVHSQSSQGKLLYQGLLTNGKSISVAGRRLWIRVGAGEHLDVRLDGKTLDGVPAGTADIVVTPTGVHSGTA